MLYVLFLCLIAFSPKVEAMSFQEAVALIQKHDSIRERSAKSDSLSEKAQMKGSWGDPTLKLAAKNYPVNTLDPNQSPMTGLDIIWSQKFPLSGRYTSQQEEMRKLAEAGYWQGEQQSQWLISQFWIQLVQMRLLQEERQILQENLDWIESMVKVSQNLYSTGKQSQQALLELKIRKSEIKSLLTTKEFEFKSILPYLSYLLGREQVSIDMQSVPWELLSRRTSAIDRRERGLQAQLAAQKEGLLARKSARIPDVTLSLGYTKRFDFDEQGDFVTLGASIPLPTSDVVYADIRSSVHEYKAAELALEDYQKKRQAELSPLRLQQQRIEAEWSILTDESISFAESSRSITTKSYQLGEASYVELLQAELKLQNLKMQKASLSAELAMTLIQIKSLLGESLYE